MRWSLSGKITASLGGLLLALSALIAVLTFLQMRRAAIEEKQSLADVMNYTFETLMSQEALPTLQRVVENDATNHGVQKILIADRNAVVRASSERMEVGKPAGSDLLRAFVARAHWERETHLTEHSLIILQPLRGSGFLGGAFGDIGGVAEMTLSREVLEADARRAAIGQLGTILGTLIVLSAISILVLRLLVTRPLQELVVVAQHFRDGDRKPRSKIRRKDEIGLLSETFDGMADQVESILSGLEAQVASRTADLEAQRGSLEAALKELKVTTEARLALADTVRELSTPVIRLYDRLIVLPLIGTINTERAQQIQIQMLAGIEKNKAAEIIIDITGVPFIDTAAADSLMRAARAVQLLGAGVTIVGITASVAQSIVHLGIDFSSIVTRANLESGLAHALEKRGLAIGRIARTSVSAEPDEPRPRAKPRVRAPGNT